MHKSNLIYDHNKWHLNVPSLHRTLQVFITNRCDRECNGCFFKSYFGNEDMSFEQYKTTVQDYIQQGIKKVILIGGEPSLHPNLIDMIKYNQDCGLPTTVYTNGRDLQMFNPINLDNVTIRIGVMGLYNSEKPLSKIQIPDYPLFIVYMIREDNRNELEETISFVEENFNCDDFMFSSIRDIETTGSFWADTKQTVSNYMYKDIVEKVISSYSGNVRRLHISCRGVISDGKHTDTCRFLNIFTDNQKIKCPLDICKHKYTDDDFLIDHKCNKYGCVLTKVVLERK